jgi:hypothetical protein
MRFTVLGGGIHDPIFQDLDRRIGIPGADRLRCWNLRKYHPEIISFGIAYGW